MQTRVIGLGQALAGDDGAGLALIEYLRPRVEPPFVQLVAAAEASRLIELLCDVDVVWIVDAVDLPDRVGEVVELDSNALCARASCSTSSHGLDAAQALALARTLYPERIAARVYILGIAIDVSALKRTLPGTGAAALSPAVTRAVGEAASRILATLPKPAQHTEVIAHARE